MMIEELAELIAVKRDRWREVRQLRLNRKEELFSQGLDVGAVRRDREYRRLKKEQHALSVALRHLEMKRNRKESREKKIS
ncbi:MAG TPA: hypothetical protein PK926_11835 [Spirochaetota bacterium]|nr:hypothetical protein [Spirochaetota bacterium]HPI89011.1 hypothetical protein [Spirochaetota bacterium]HPR49281.1 hypothetical protein [Spirochaetota bacterium]